MSYMVYRERTFCEKGETPPASIFKRKASGKMRCVNSMSDPRSWSLDPSLRREFFLDTINNGFCSSNENFISSLSETSVQKRKLSSIIKVFKSRFFAGKIKSPESDINLESERSEEKLVEANEVIERLIFEKEQLYKISKDYEYENDDLRSFVHDVHEELCFLQSLKAENTMLKAELSIDSHKKMSEAQEEINFLNSQIEIYKDYKNKYDSLRRSQDNLKEDYDQINLSLKEMEWNTERMKKEIVSLVAKVNELKSREQIVSNALIDKELLRERLQMREEKISCLVSFLEEQEMIIQDLVLQLQRMTSHIITKEGAAGRQIHSLKFSLNEKTSRINELEDKLHTSDLLIRELEKIKDHFRISNCALAENMQNYKKQFNIVVSCSKKLLAELELYKTEVSKKNVQIQRLSVFPQSASSIVQFAQLLNILKTSEELLHSDERSAVSFIPVMKHIVEKLKLEIIGNQVEYPLYELYNDETQTEYLGTDKCTQNERFSIEDKIVEVDLPDRYFFEYEKSQIHIAEQNKIIELLKESFQRVDSVNHSLEKKVISSIAEKSVKEKEISELHNELHFAHELLQTLKTEMGQNDSLLRKSLCEIELERGVSESTSEILVATIETTTCEYEMYIKVLEAILKYKEEKIQFLEQYICNENCSKEAPENEYVIVLENEITQLSSRYANEKQNVKELNIQISKLQAALAEKMDHFKIVQEKLLRAEKIFEHLNNIENQCVTKHYSGIITNSPELVILPPEEMVASNNVLPHVEGLESRFKEEFDLTEKFFNETVSKDFVLHLTQKTSFQKRNMKKTIVQLKRNITRLKGILMKLKKKIKISDCMNQDYSIRFSKLDSYYNDIKKEREYLTDQLQIEKAKALNMEMCLEKQSLELCYLRDKKIKVENILIKIIKQLEKRAKSVNQIKLSKQVNTDENVFKNYESDIIKLREEIKELKNENKTLSAEILNLEERLAMLYIPQKENDSPSTISVEIQTHLSGDSYTVIDVQKHYENVIQILQKDKAMEKEKSEIMHTNAVRKIKDSYETEITNIRQSHHKQVSKLQLQHEREIENLKQLHQENSRDLVSKCELEHVHLQDIEKLKSHYETLLHCKETEEFELSKEIKELKEEVGNIISQKQKDDLFLNNKIKEQLNLAKKKFKKQYKILKKTYDAEMLELTNKHNNEIKNVCSENTSNNEKSSIECQTALAESELTKDIIYIKEKELINENIGQTTSDSFISTTTDINVKERIQYSIKEANDLIPKEIFNILNVFGSSGVSVFNPYPEPFVKSITNRGTRTAIKAEGLKLIVEKTENIKGNFQDVLSNKEKCLVETYGELLKQERVRSSILQRGLYSELRRTERLEAENDDLLKQIIKLRSDLQLTKSNYDNLKKSLSSMTIQRKTSEKLGMSLERLKNKLEKAMQSEKRLSEELQEDKKANERIKGIIESNSAEGETRMEPFKKPLIETENITEPLLQESSVVTKDVTQKIEVMKTAQVFTNNIQGELSNKTDLKVIFIQRCGILHSWRGQFFSMNN